MTDNTNSVQSASVETSALAQESITALNKALFAAAEANDGALVTALIQKGANPFIMEKGRFVEDCAASAILSGGGPVALLALKNAGTDFNAEDYKGNNLLLAHFVSNHLPFLLDLRDGKIGEEGQAFLEKRCTATDVIAEITKCFKDVGIDTTLLSRLLSPQKSATLALPPTPSDVAAAPAPQILGTAGEPASVERIVNPVRVRE